MNLNPHISDHLLQQVVDAHPAIANQAEIETHVGHCVHCQTRILALAADPTWRHEFVKKPIRRMWGRRIRSREFQLECQRHSRPTQPTGWRRV